MNNDFKCYCTNKQKIITFKEYTLCWDCYYIDDVNGTCKTREIIGDCTDLDKNFESNMISLIRERKLKRILNE